ncbi:MAG: hypothetical protein IKW35_07640 [Paludibacteraceae bacterium]|nr:hypothetical protein [Paludibacteraceae bacterium]
MAKYLKRSDTFDFITAKSSSGVDLAIMDYALKCRGGECDIYDTCPYNEGYELCQIHKQYTNHIIKMVYRYDREGKLNEHQLHVIGMTMMPLYTHLFRFQLAEMALSTPVVYGKTIYMHPVYKEIRNTTKLLFDIWAKMGLGVGVSAPMPERGTGGSVYDIISAAEGIDEDVEESVSKQTKNKVEDIVIVDEAMEDSDNEDDIMDSLEKARKSVGGRTKGKNRRMGEEARALMEAAEEASMQGFTIESEDGEEAFVIEEGFDPRDLPEASEIDFQRG